MRSNNIFLNLPNLISFARLLSVPLTVWLILHEIHLAAFWVFVVACISDAADGFLWAVGADKTYVASGYSYFTVETSIKFMTETHAGEDIIVETTVKLIDGKKLKLFHSMQRAEDSCILSTCEQFLLHIDMKKRKSSLPISPVAENLQNLSIKI